MYRKSFADLFQRLHHLFVEPKFGFVEYMRKICVIKCKILAFGRCRTYICNRKTTTKINTAMKKFYQSLSVMLSVLSSLVMVSCDDDVQRSIELSGSWNGDFGMYYVDGKGREWDSYDTDIVFYPDYDYATRGYGQQVDWYKHGPYTKMYYRFYWQIRNGVIYLDYPQAPELNTAIYDYRLNNCYFSGMCEGASTPFRLGKIEDYYNWSCYNGYDYGYYYDDDWYWDYDYYTYTRSGEADEGLVIAKRGNRFNENR